MAHSKHTSPKHTSPACYDAIIVCFHRHQRLKPEVGWKGEWILLLAKLIRYPSEISFPNCFFFFPLAPLLVNYLTFGLHLLSQVSSCLPCFALANRPGDDFTAIRFFPQYQAYLNSWIPHLPILFLFHPEFLCLPYIHRKTIYLNMSSSRPTTSANRATASSNRPSTSSASSYATNHYLKQVGSWTQDKPKAKVPTPKSMPASGQQPGQTSIGNNSSMSPMLRAYVNQDPRSGPWSPAVMQRSDARRWWLSFSSTTNPIPFCHRYPSSFYITNAAYMEELFWFWIIGYFSWDTLFQGVTEALCRIKAGLWTFRGITRMGG